MHRWIPGPVLFTAALCAQLCSLARAQSPAHLPPQPAQAVVSGLVADPSGALVPNATVVLHGASGGVEPTTLTSPAGRYKLSLTSCAPCTLSVSAPGFAQYESAAFNLDAPASKRIDVALQLATRAEQVDVADDTAIDTDPTHNGNAIVLRGSDIAQLPLDTAQLMGELQALSGGSAPDLFVDGFSNGTLPPRDTIREIRINQNPYSALNDTSPGNGRIEVFTKPGANSLHGSVYAYANLSAINTQNPFGGPQPGYYTDVITADLNGPLSKRASFFVNFGRDDAETNALVSAQTVDSSGNLYDISQAVPSPLRTLRLSPRVDFAPSRASTLVARYSLTHLEQLNGGIGGLSLATYNGQPSQGYTNLNTVQLFQLSNSQILSPRTMNDTRFQYTRSRVAQTPASDAPTLLVQGSFVGGGSNAGAYHDNQDRYELQNYVSTVRRQHFITFGGRFRAIRDANHSLANYNGTFTFASLAAFAAQQPSQYSVTQGNPNVVVSIEDFGAFLQDDWHLRPNLTLSGGLRFESQTSISDHADWAPRAGFAWGIRQAKGKPATTILRGGAGIFYNRFPSGYLLQAVRQDGITQREYITASNLNALNVPSAAALAQSPSATYQINPNLQAPYLFSATAALERQIRRWGNVSLTYLYGRGVHSLLTRNINAPLPGTYNPAVPQSGTRPLGGSQDLYEYESAGHDRTNRLNTNFNLRLDGGRFFVYGFYQLRRDSADTNGGFPSNQFNLAADQGRASTDVRHSGNLGFGADLPFGFHSYTFAWAHSGAPYNITVGQDLNGDSIFNDRPAYATDLTRPSVVQTARGPLDSSPIAGQTIIPINFGHGPGFFEVNFNLDYTFSFGPPTRALAPGAKGHVDRRFSMDIGFDAQNIFNQVNLGPPIGNLNSPLFSRSVSLANNLAASSSANRVFNLQTALRF